MEEKAKEPDVAWSENTVLIAVASTVSPELRFQHIAHKQKLQKIQHSKVTGSTAICRTKYIPRGVDVAWAFT